MNLMISKISDTRWSQNTGQFLKYIVVGFINTGAYYGIYYVMLKCGFSYALAVTSGTVVGSINSYFWNKFFTFRSKEKSIAEVIKFFVVYGVQYLSNLFTIYLCVNYVGISEELAGLAAIGVGFFISYFGHTYWSFRQ